MEFCGPVTSPLVVLELEEIFGDPECHGVHRGGSGSGRSPQNHQGRISPGGCWEAEPLLSNVPMGNEERGLNFGVARGTGAMGPCPFAGHHGWETWREQTSEGELPVGASLGFGCNKGKK